MSEESRDAGRDENGLEEEAGRGVPGEGKGRKDVVEPSGVYPASAGEAPSDSEIRTMGEWGHGTRETDGHPPRRANREEAPSERSGVPEDLE